MFSSQILEDYITMDYALEQGLEFRIEHFSNKYHFNAEELMKIINGENKITPDLAKRLGEIFGKDAGADFWIRLQHISDTNASLV